MKNIIQLPIQRSLNAKPRLIYKDKLRVPTNSGIFIIRKSEILFLKSDSNYCEIYTVGGKRVFCAKTLKYFACLLSEISFFRLHNSYIVNLNYITFIDYSNKKVEVLDKFLIPIARSRQECFKMRLKVFCD